MSIELDRRDFARLLGLGGVVFASGLGGPFRRAAVAAPAEDFFFVQLSDTHWGFQGPPNPEAKNTLKLAVQAVNALPAQPDFIVFTGDLTHTTDDVDERRKRMTEFREIVGGLKVKNLRFMPGEHDASLDNGKAFQEFFGPTRYSFDHKGVHFVVVDNVSDPGAAIGPEQLAWLAGDLKKQDPAAPIVVFTHRPLFDLYPQWDWATRDGGKAIEILMPHANVTVFYGHIHQEHHKMTGHIAHHSAKALMFPLPAPGSQPKRDPVPWDPAHPYQGLGFRNVDAEVARAEFAIAELPIQKG
jgi:hypothetical protein